MIYETNTERQTVLSQALSATSPEDIEDASECLQNWVGKHPDDLGIVDAFEQLAIMRGAVKHIVSPVA